MINQKKVLLIGEAMTLLISDDFAKLEEVNKFSKGVSGAEVNVCVGLTRLGFKTEYVTRLGADPFGKYIHKFLEEENIGLKYFVYDYENNTGIQIKSKVVDGDPDVYYYRSNSAATKINKFMIDSIDLSEIDLVHITGIPLAISETAREAVFYLIERAKRENKFITFDPNLRLQLWKDKDLMKEIINEISVKADLIIPGISEAQILLDKENIEDIIEEYLKMGVKKIIIKNGSKGSFYVDKDIKIFEPSFIVEKVIDTVGAGDGFAVGVISAILDGLKPNLILERANAIGSIQVRNISDNAGLPTREQLEEYIKTTKKKEVNL